MVNHFQAQVWTNISLIGPAQGGKSTLAGFLLYALGEVEPRVMRKAEDAARARGDLSKKFAFLLDQRPSERRIELKGRGVTEEASWWGYSRKQRHFLLIDSPGQYDYDYMPFLVGALSEADVAVLVISVPEYLEAMKVGEIATEKSRLLHKVYPTDWGQARAYTSIAHFFGVRQLVIALHQMDRVHFSERHFTIIGAHLRSILEDFGWDSSEIHFVPTAVRAEDEVGYNVTERADVSMKWYKGPTLLEVLDSLQPKHPRSDHQFRLQVDGVYQNRKGVPGYQLVVTGKVLTGTVKVGDKIVFQPSGVHCRIRTIKSIDASKKVERQDRWGHFNTATAGQIVGIASTITDFERNVIHVSRGEVAGVELSPANVGTQIRAKLIVLHIPPLEGLLSGRFSGTFGMGYFHTGFRVERYSLDGGDIWKMVKRRKEKKHDGKEGEVDGNESITDAFRIKDLKSVERGTILDVELTLSRVAPLDLYVPETGLGRFVLLDPAHFVVCGGQITTIL